MGQASARYPPGDQQYKQDRSIPSLRQVLLRAIGPRSLLPVRIEDDDAGGLFLHAIGRAQHVFQGLAEEILIGSHGNQSRRRSRLWCEDAVVSRPGLELR